MAVALLLVATAGCSRTPQALTSSSPAAPTAVAVGGSLLSSNIGGVSGKLDAVFPPRSDLFTFVVNADEKYQGMGRSTTASYIDREGVAVWMQEYIRYRVNGCDHTTALQRVSTQISGGAAGGVCGSVPDGPIIFPSRADSFAAMREFDAAYLRMGRGQANMFIDLEGAAIWIQEYLRYRLNACDAATAQQKVFAQIDGGPVAATCFVSCSYTLLPASVSTGSGSMSSSFEIRPVNTFSDPRSCGWSASSDASWLTISSGYQSGSGFTTVPYSIARNDGGDRTGRINFSWTGGSTSFVASQAGTPFAADLTMTDPARSGTATTTECFIRSSSTSCRFTATANLPGGGYSYAWSAQWNGRSSSATNSSNTFTITEQCGTTNSSSGGSAADLTVQVTITDDRNNSITLSRTYTMRLFTC